MLSAQGLASAATRLKKLPPASRSPIAPADDAAKPLGVADLVGIGVGGTLGSGLFLLAGRAAREVAGPAVSASFALAALACLFSGLSYAEMASRAPDCGGAYAFAYAALGELPAFLVGSCLTLEYGVASAAIARSWASYLGGAFTFLPDWFVGAGGGVAVGAAFLVLGMTALLAGGMREAKWVINFTTIMYAAVVVVIIAVGLMDVDVGNFAPFAPFGMAGVLTGASHVFFSFIGFDEVATMSDEARNAGTAVPLAMILSLAIVAVIYVSASLVLVGMVNYTAIDVEAPFSAAFNTVNRPNIAFLVGIGTAIGMMNTCMVSLAAQPRIFVSMGRDGLLPKFVASTMRVTTIRCGIVVALFACFVSTEALAALVSGGTLLAFLATNLALICNRSQLHSLESSRWPLTLAVGSTASGIMYRLAIQGTVPMSVAALFVLPAVLFPTLNLLREDMRGGSAFEADPPAFLCPLVPALPIAGVLTTTVLLTQLPTPPLLALAIWLLVSFAIYIFYGMHNSVAASHLSLEEEHISTSSRSSYDGTGASPSGSANPES